jgi:hypothetical protein
MRGLDPRIHHFRKLDCRVKPGNDDFEGVAAPMGEFKRGDDGHGRRRLPAQELDGELRRQLS